MLKYFILFILLSTLLTQVKNIKLNTDPSKENTIKVELKLTLQNGEDGYYDGASAVKSPNGVYVVLDRGNKQILLFDNKGEIIRTFGEEGNGPGELSNPYRVFVTKSHIYIRQNMVVIMFDYNGKYIKDISIMSAGKSGTPLIHNDHLVVAYSGDTADRLIYFDSTGNVKQKIPNSEYVRPKEGNNNTSVSTTSNFNYASDGSNFYQTNSGSYSVDIINSEFRVIKKYTKDFNRVVNDYSGVKINISGDNMTEKQKAKQMAAIMNQIKKKYGEYHSDAGSILGASENKLYIHVADADENNLTFHLIQNDTFIDSYTLRVNGDVKEARIAEGELIVTYKNDEDGPVVEVYSLL